MQIDDAEHIKIISFVFTDVHLDKETLLQEEINKFPSLTASQALVHLPTEHARELGRCLIMGYSYILKHKYL